MKKFIKDMKNILKTLRNKTARLYSHPLHIKLDEILQKYDTTQFGTEINPIDAFFAYRLLLGRNPSLLKELPDLLSLKKVTLREFLNNLIGSEEFSKSPGFLPPNKILLSEIENFRFWFNSSDREMGVVMALGYYEPFSVELIKKIVKPGMICVDAGAQTGFYTCLMASIGAEVHAFEPMEKSYDLLVKNIQENNFQERVKTYKIACSDSNKPLSGSIVSNMYVSTEINQGEKITIQAAAVDDILTSQVDIIKIDIEGHEPQALDGMKNIIINYKPIIFSEINEYWLQRCSGISASQYVNILNNLNYQVFAINDLKNPLEPRTLKLEILETMDIIAFHNDREMKW
ncbi:FkbM family methyltransferase [Sphaerospermopsis reniformis]|uniref:FkbM family methyltransferase n=1 Tax=Sphaerospermopsis reniformis TaxID=531300 RepID=A0A480ABS0_9CYAN|nr:FkbM family methyltransferase [Sphaerospermopsis reniformis]GCL39554.1 FkbM family methyltransferase [Sphaerospermopsis reniformis]